MEIIETDVAIVGGGPAGCTCALYTSRSNLKTVIIDKNPSVGALAITHQIANYPGVPVDISGEKLLTLMREQAVQYGTDYRRAQVLVLIYQKIGKLFIHLKELLKLRHSYLQVELWVDLLLLKEKQIF